MTTAFVLALFAGCTSQLEKPEPESAPALCAPDIRPKALVLEDGPWRVLSSHKNPDGSWTDYAYVGRVFAMQDPGSNTNGFEERFEIDASEFLSSTVRWRVIVEPWTRDHGPECAADDLCATAKIGFIKGYREPDDSSALAVDPCTTAGVCRRITEGYHQDAWYKITASDDSTGYVDIDRSSSPWRERIYTLKNKHLPWPNDNDNDNTPGATVRWDIQQVSDQEAANYELVREYSVADGYYNP